MAAWPRMTLAQRGTTPVVGFLGSLTRVERTSLAQLAIKYRLPSMFGTRENMETGGLMSYAPDQADLTRLAATYIDKMFKGDKPAILPVEQASKYRLAINLGTANCWAFTCHRRCSPSPTT